HRAVGHEKLKRPPFWFMRQAGRYLPEYRKIRSDVGGFLNLCYNPELAAEVTLQPIKRFDMDAAIIFSDILVIPHAMGMNLSFEVGEGPKLTPIRNLQAAKELKFNHKHLLPVTEAIKIVRVNLDSKKSLIGFCGSPWTVACYMVEGGSSRDYEFVRNFALQEEKAFALIIDKIVKASVYYLSMQVKAGADIVQIFDSWAGVLSENEYRKWVIEPTKEIVTLFKSIHNQTPIIGFPRGSGMKYEIYAKETGVDVVGIDVQTPMNLAKERIAKPLQGNLCPILLANDKNAAIAETKRILDIMKGKPFIFNLGHGILQHTPIENVEAVCKVIKGEI
ncbi:MAG: uroporphyrinogen decarboxylase, partial [Pseudomonadota bacterium]